MARAGGRELPSEPEQLGAGEVSLSELHHRGAWRKPPQGRFHRAQRRRDSAIGDQVDARNGHLLLSIASATVERARSLHLIGA